MNTYTEILKELQTFRGGEFVPIWSEAMTGKLKLTWHDINEEFLWIDEDGDDEGCSDHNAHAHIREAAWKAVRWFCASNKSDLTIMDNFPGDPERHDLIKKQWNGVVTKLGSGPDDATALLAAMKFINGGGA